MVIVSIDKVGHTVYGCVDDGVYYHIVTAEPDAGVLVETKFDKNNYKNYNHFVLAYGQVDPCCCFLEAPLEMDAPNIEALSYENLLEMWQRVWG